MEDDLNFFEMEDNLKKNNQKKSKVKTMVVAPLGVTYLNKKSHSSQILPILLESWPLTF